MGQQIAGTLKAAESQAGCTGSPCNTGHVVRLPSALYLNYKNYIALCPCGSGHILLMRESLKEVAPTEVLFVDESRQLGETFHAALAALVKGQRQQRR